jgi:hypothetical protein
MDNSRILENNLKGRMYDKQTEDCICIIYILEKKEETTTDTTINEQKQNKKKKSQT